MKATFLVSALLAFGLASASAQIRTREASRQRLFDGRSLVGWSPEGAATWRVDGGSIVGDAGGDGWLRSERQFADFSLRIEFRNSAGGNSGVFLRASRDSNRADPSNPASGYELQINNDDTAWATGSIENFIQRLTPVAPSPNAWHSYQVDVHGDHLVAVLDGTTVLDGHDPRFQTGYIGLQHHTGSAIAFRQITIQVTQ